MRVVVGGYDGSVSGWLPGADVEELLELGFAYKAHTSCVKCVAISNGTCATGSTDTTVKLYDLYSKRESISLPHNSGVCAVDVLCVSESVCVMTGDELGDVRVFRSLDKNEFSECLLKGHKRAAVTDVCVHPSGRLAFSVSSKDFSLRMWDLVNDKAANRVVLEGRGSGLTKCAFNAAGSRFLVLGEYDLWVFDVESVDKGPTTRVERIKSRLNDACFGSNDSVYACDDAGSVLEVEKDSLRSIFESKNGRCKAVSWVCDDAVFGSSVLCCAYSCGVVEILVENENVLTLKTTTSANLVCLAALADDDDDEEEEEDEEVDASYAHVHESKKRKYTVEREA